MKQTTINVLLVTSFWIITLMGIASQCFIDSSIIK